MSRSWTGRWFSLLKPLSLRLVRQTRTTRAAVQKDVVDSAKCDGELTVMEQPEAPSSARPIELYRHPEHQVLGGRQIDNRIHSRQSMLFHNRPITGIWAQHRSKFLAGRN